MLVCSSIIVLITPNFSSVMQFKIPPGIAKKQQLKIIQPLNVYSLYNQKEANLPQSGFCSCSRPFCLLSKEFELFFSRKLKMGAQWNKISMVLAFSCKNNMIKYAIIAYFSGLFDRIMLSWVGFERSLLPLHKLAVKAVCDCCKWYKGYGFTHCFLQLMIMSKLCPTLTMYQQNNALQ